MSVVGVREWGWVREWGGVRGWGGFAWMHAAPMGTPTTPALGPNGYLEPKTSPGSTPKSTGEPEVQANDTNDTNSRWSRAGSAADSAVELGTPPRVPIPRGPGRAATRGPKDRASNRRWSATDSEFGVDDRLGIGSTTDSEFRLDYRLGIRGRRPTRNPHPRSLRQCAHAPPLSALNAGPVARGHWASVGCARRPGRAHWRSEDGAGTLRH